MTRTKPTEDRKWNHTPRGRKCSLTRGNGVMRAVNRRQWNCDIRAVMHIQSPLVVARRRDFDHHLSDSNKVPGCTSLTLTIRIVNGFLNASRQQTAAIKGRPAQSVYFLNCCSQSHLDVAAGLKSLFFSEVHGIWSSVTQCVWPRSRSGRKKVDFKRDFAVELTFLLI